MQNTITIQLTPEQIEAIKNGAKIELVAPEKEKAKGRYMPTKGKWYFFIEDDGYINSGIWDGVEIQVRRLLTGNVFETKEDAGREINRKKAEVYCLDRIAEANNGWKPDWSDQGQDKYLFFYIRREKQLDFMPNNVCQSQKSDWYMSESTALKFQNDPEFVTNWKLAHGIE